MFVSARPEPEPDPYPAVTAALTRLLATKYCPTYLRDAVDPIPWRPTSNRAEETP